jgi:hypothetical protein
MRTLLRAAAFTLFLLGSAHAEWRSLDLRSGLAWNGPAHFTDFGVAVYGSRYAFSDQSLEIADASFYGLAGDRIRVHWQSYVSAGVRESASAGFSIATSTYREAIRGAASARGPWMADGLTTYSGSIGSASAQATLPESGLYIIGVFAGLSWQGGGQAFEQVPGNGTPLYSTVIIDSIEINHTIPEPGSLAMLICGLLAIAGFKLGR